MVKKKQIDIALLGCGKMGKGIYDVFLKSRHKILEQEGVNLNIKYILIKHGHYKRPSWIPRDILVTDADAILADDRIQIVIDAIGGIEPTYTIIKRFIDKGCHLVSANRTLLASKMHELFDLALSRQVHLRFEAAIGGGIPMIRAFRRDLIATKITSMWGIISGSSNYILSQMTENNKTIEDVLAMPELHQLTESHMMLDYEGTDAAQKLSLVAATVFGADVNYHDIYAEGISRITQFDIECAHIFGYEFKHLAIAKDRKDGLELRVHPTMIAHNHPLTSVTDDYIAFYVNTDLIGNFMVYGKGAGVHPAASVIIRELVDISTEIKTDAKYMYEFPIWNEKNIVAMEDIYSGFYLRFNCIDVPGVMGNIATILGKHNINISSAHASVEDKQKEDNFAYLHIFITHAMEKQIIQALAKIKELNVIKDDPVYFRILDEGLYDTGAA